MAKKRSSRLVAYAWLYLNTILWGVVPVLAKYNFTSTTPYRFLFYRFIFACIFSLPILLYYWSKIKNFGKILWTIVWLEAIGTSATLTLLYIGLQFTTATEASLITALSPLFVTLGGWFFLKEKVENHEKTGLGLALLGSVFLAATPLLTKNHTANFSFWGGLLIFAQDMVYVVYLLLIKKQYQKIPKFFITTISFWVGLITFALFSLIEVNFKFATLVTAVNSELLGSWQTLSIALYMAIGGSILGLTAYLKGHDLIEASEASLFWYLQPLVTIPLGMMLLKEQIFWPQVVALILIFFGVFLAEK